MYTEAVVKEFEAGLYSGDQLVTHALVYVRDVPAAGDAGLHGTFVPEVPYVVAAGEVYRMWRKTAARRKWSSAWPRPAATSGRGSSSTSTARSSGARDLHRPAHQFVSGVSDAV